MPTSELLDQLKHGTADNPIEDLFLRRWSPRAFSEQPVSNADLKTIFTAAAWAASSYNEQPWRFLVGCKGDGSWEKILAALVPPNQAWAKAAPVLYAAFAKTTFSHNGLPNDVATHDLGAASAQVALQATALGLYTHGMAGFHKEALRTAFAVPTEFEPVACWALGYLGKVASLPEELQGMEEQPRQRRALREFTFSEWGRAAF